VLVIGDSCKPQSTEDVLEHSCRAKKRVRQFQIFVMLEETMKRILHHHRVVQVPSSSESQGRHST
jgi:hypothetical protein